MRRKCEGCNYYLQRSGNCTSNDAALPISNRSRPPRFPCLTLSRPSSSFRRDLFRASSEALFSHVISVRVESLYREYEETYVDARTSVEPIVGRFRSVLVRAACISRARVSRSCFLRRPNTRSKREQTPIMTRKRADHSRRASKPEHVRRVIYRFQFLLAEAALFVVWRTAGESIKSLSNFQVAFGQGILVN